jgi:hypothetical protein
MREKTAEASPGVLTFDESTAHALREAEYQGGGVGDVLALLAHVDRGGLTICDRE